MGIGLSRCRIGRERFMMGKWLQIAYFPTSVFLIRVVFPRFLSDNKLFHSSYINSRDHIRASSLCIDILIQDLLVSSSCNASINQ